MELHGENPFKVRSYQSAADISKTFEKEYSSLSSDEILEIEGIGKGMATSIGQMLETGSFDRLDKLLIDTPSGVVEMLKISGFGPKKIGVLWQEGGAETLEDILLMCEQGQVTSLKGFAEKSQQSLLRAAQFVIEARGFAKYAQVEPVMLSLLKVWEESANFLMFSETGALRRRMEVVDKIEFLIGTYDVDSARLSLNQLDCLSEIEEKSSPLSWYGRHALSNIPVRIRFCQVDQFHNELLATTSHPKHLHAVLNNGKSLYDILSSKVFDSEVEIYEQAKMQYVAPELREGGFELKLAQEKKLPSLIEMSDLNGVLHNHSTYSDGKHTLRQMAEHCRDLGYEYLGISDHSQTAVYAGGLKDFEVKQQQEEIVKLNTELAPFKILSGIESDILADGSLDYSDEVLNSFDFVVVSIHSGLNMDSAKATKRLLNAIHNPYTTILGHMTGRLILEREGYPVDHKAIIDACADRGVVIEINASPYRLDIDWRWVRYALDKGVMLSINPDAHAMEGYKDMYYGILAGRKGGLTKEMTLNVMNLSEIEDFLKKRRPIN